MAITGTKRSRWRWPRRIVIALVVLLLIGAGGILLLFYLSERDWREALAEADRLDPGWSFAELEAKRAEISDEENSARRVLAAHALLPDPWPAWLEMPDVDFDFDFDKNLRALPPNAPLKQAQIAALNHAWTAAAAAVAEARMLKDMPVGRYPIVMAENGARRLGPHLAMVASLADLLTYDVLLRQRDADPDGALASCRARVNLARAFGDESNYRSQLARMRHVVDTCPQIERTLAQGQPSAGSLTALQTLLEDEEAQPLFLNGARGLRIEMHESVEAVADGKTKIDRIPDWAQSSFVANVRPLTLRTTTHVVEAGKKPFEARFPEVRRVMPMRTTAHYFFDKYIFPFIEKYVADLAGGEIRTRAAMRCTIAALAADRYRREHGVFPKALPELVPVYLRAVPTDPFDGEPLRYRWVADGVVFYCLGDDLIDHQGELDRDPVARGANIGLQLWDIAPPR
jgi:hypothetical protein